MQQFGEVAIGGPAPECAPNLDRHHRSVTGGENMLGGVTPTIKRLIG
jgi:hypothetical protein